MGLDPAAFALWRGLVIAVEKNRAKKRERERGERRRKREKEREREGKEGERGRGEGEERGNHTRVELDVFGAPWVPTLTD